MENADCTCISNLQHHTHRLNIKEVHEFKKGRKREGHIFFPVPFKGNKKPENLDKKMTKINEFLN